MKRSKNITLLMLTTIAACAMACDETKSTPVDEGEIKHCVDQDGVVQEESKCATVPDAPHDHDGSAPPHHANGGGGHGGFFWYYGGTRTTPGTKVTGGSYRPTPGRTYSPPSKAPTFSGSHGGGSTPHGGGGTPSIGRGGFGGVGGGHAGGGGGS